MRLLDLGNDRRLVATALSVLWIGVGVLAATTSAIADDDDDDDKNSRDGLPVYLDRPVHPTAQDSCTPGFIWQGAGNPATTFQRKRDEDAGIELAIKAIIRQGADIRSTYVDADGLIHIEVPTGPQTPQTSTTPRAAWNFTFSYDVALDPSNPTLDHYDAELWIDLDPSRDTDYLKLRLARFAPTPPPSCLEPDSNGFGWKTGNTFVIADDEGTARVTQNSQNLAFYASEIDTDPKTRGIQPYTFGPGQFDVVMKIDRKGRSGSHGRHDDVELHVVFDVVPPPGTQTP